MVNLTRAQAQRIQENGDYWKERAAIEMAVAQKRDSNMEEELTRLYERQKREIEKEIQAFYFNYAIDNKVSVADAKARVNAMDVALFADKAKQYVKEKDFSDKANKELKVYNLAMKTSRLEMLKYNIDLELIALANGEEKAMQKRLDDAYQASIRSQAGILGKSVIEDLKTNREMAERVINTPFHETTWSDKIWDRQNELRKRVATLIERDVLRGQNPSKSINELARDFKVTKSQAMRLVMTESTRVTVQNQHQIMANSGYEYYEVLIEPGACSICRPFDEKPQRVDELVVGLNAPPFHPNCRCSIVASTHGLREEIDEWLASDEQYESLEEWRTRTGRDKRLESDSERYESDYKRFKRRQQFPKYEDAQGVTKKQYAQKKKLYAAATRRDFSNGTELGKRVVILFGDQSIIETLNAEKVCYEKGRIYLNMFLSLVDPRGVSTSLFHEQGHQIDDRLGWKFTNDKKLRDLILLDFANADKKWMRHEIMTNPKASSTSDIAEGIPGGIKGGPYGHKPEYWKNEKHLSSEFFAHVIEAQFDKERRKILEKAFPTAYNYVTEDLKRLVR